MSSNLKKKYELFGIGRQAYKTYSNSTTNYYCCPICRNLFTIYDIYNKNLTLEHIPPKHLGGRGIALTCASCNNTSGHTVDSEIAKREDVLKLTALFTQKGKYAGDIKLDFRDPTTKPPNFHLTVDNEKVRFYFKPKHNPPGSLDTAIHYFSKHKRKTKNSSPLSFSTIQKYNQRLADVGYLKSAYLICFAAYGYKYALDKHLDKVREQIINYDKKILDGYIIRSSFEYATKNTLLLIDSPFHALSVIFNDTAVILPLPSFIQGATTVYETIRSTYKKITKIDFAGTVLKWPTSLVLKWDFDALS